MGLLDFILNNLLGIILICVILYYLPTLIRFWKKWKLELNKAKSSQEIDSVITQATSSVLTGNALKKETKDDYYGTNKSNLT